MQGYSDTRWSKRHAGQQAQDWSLPRAWTGPGDSKQGFPGAVPAAKSRPARTLREPTGTGSVSGLFSVFLGSKSNEVWFRSRERASPSQEMPHPGKMGRGTLTLLLGAILKCWALYPWDPMRGCGNGGRVGVVGREGSSQKGTPCGRPWDRSCHVGAQRAPLETPPSTAASPMQRPCGAMEVDGRAKGSYLVTSARCGEKHTMENTASTRYKNSHRAATRFSVSAARICSGGKTHPVHSPHPGERMRILHKQGWTRRP